MHQGVPVFGPKTQTYGLHATASADEGHPLEPRGVAFIGGVTWGLSIAPSTGLRPLVGPRPDSGGPDRFRISTRR